MDRLGCLYQCAEDHSIEVDFFLLDRATFLAVPLGDGACAIALDPTKLETTVQETVELAHELGHCIAGVFYGPESPQILINKCEYKASKWAIKKLIPEKELMAALQHGYTEFWELAEHFNVTEDLVKKAICLYTYGNLNTEIYFGK